VKRIDGLWCIFSRTIVRFGLGTLKPLILPGIKVFFHLFFPFYIQIEDTSSFLFFFSFLLPLLKDVTVCPIAKHVSKSEYFFLRGTFSLDEKFRFFPFRAQIFL